MPHENILIEKFNRSITKITLNRPENQNALSLELMKELCEALKKIEDSECKVLILNAKGKNFCAGLDLKQASDEVLRDTMILQIASLFTLLHHTSLVTIAAVQGHAMAGGGGLAAACDIVLLSEEAMMGFPETRRGIVAAQVATILVRQLSMRHVRELLLTGHLVDSKRAVEIGLANQVVNLGQLQNEALRTAEEVLKGAPSALKATKGLLEKLIPDRFSEDLELALSIYHSARNSQEAKEGIASFLEKRPPKWNFYPSYDEDE